MITLAFDSISSSRIANLISFSENYITKVDAAITESALLLREHEYNTIQATFMGSTGQLAESIMEPIKANTLSSLGTGEEDLRTDEPYANRIEFGFNAVDSLGRKYNQSAHPYAQPSIDQTQPEAYALYEAAILSAWEGTI